MKGWPRVAAAPFLAVVWAACVRHPRWRDAVAGAPFIRDFGLVFVELDSHEGPPVLALLDTGANASAIDPRVAGDRASLGKTEVVGTTGTLAAEIVGVEGLREAGGSPRCRRRGGI